MTVKDGERSVKWPPKRVPSLTGPDYFLTRAMCSKGPRVLETLSHSVGSAPNCPVKGLPARTWRLRGLYAKFRGPCQDK